MCIHAATYCFLVLCVWFEIKFQNDLNLHSKFGWKLEKKKKRLFFPLSLFGLLAQFQRRLPHSLRVARIQLGLPPAGPSPSACTPAGRSAPPAWACAPRLPSRSGPATQPRLRVLPPSH